MRRHDRWIFRSLAALLGLVALFVLAVQLLLWRGLAQPWVKRRLAAIARATLGADIDYRAARIDLLSGADIEGLVVETPAKFRRFAPQLVRVGRLDARWSLASWVRRRPVLRWVSVSDVTFTAVIDEQGDASFDVLVPPGPSREPVVPLSHRAAKLLSATPPAGRLRVDDVALVLVRTRGDREVERTELRGLSLALVTDRAAPATGGWRAEVSLGSAASPLELELSRAPEDGPRAVARAMVWADVGVDSDALSAALDLRMIGQTLMTGLSAGKWLHAEARLRFDRVRGQTEVTLDPVRAADGAASIDASIDLPDVGAPAARRVRGEVDVARLLRWLPAGLVPVVAERASVRLQVDSLGLGPSAGLSTGAVLSVDADVANVAVETSSGSVHVAGGSLSGRATSGEAGAIEGSASVKLGGVRIMAGGDRLAMDGMVLDFDGRRGPGAEITGRAGLRFASLEQASAYSLVAHDGRVELRVGGLHPDVRDPLATRGDVALSIDLPWLGARSSKMSAAADGLTLDAHGALEGRAPYAAEIETRARRVRVYAPGGATMVDAPAHVRAKLHDIAFDPARPRAAAGTADVEVDLGDVQASLGATKSADAVDFALRAAARSLGAVRPLLPAALAGAAPWDRIAVTVRSSGRVEHLAGAAPAVRHTTRVDVQRPAFGDAAARSLSLTLESQGTALEHHADVDVVVPGLALGSGQPIDDHLTLSATLDRLRPSLDFKVEGQGHARAKLSGSLSFDPARRALLYDVEGRLSGLQPLATALGRVKGLSDFDLSALEVGLSAHGALLGIVAAVAPAIRLDPSPARTAGVDGTADLRLAHLRWVRGDAAIATPAIAWHGEMRSSGPRRRLDSKLEVGTIHLDLGDRDIDLNGVRDGASVSAVGDLTDPQIEVAQRLSIGAVEQDVVPEYPTGDVTFALSAERSPEGVIHVSDLKVDNGRGGTSLSLSGNVDLGEGRRTLSVVASVGQDLSRLSVIPDRFRGQGKLTVDATVTSPNFTLYRVRAAVKGESVTVALPRAGVAVDAANGEVPIDVELETSGRGIELKRNLDRSPYSMLRFSDQHPLLAHSGFLSISRVTTPLVSIAPLVGNLSIDQNVVALRQFEMGVRGGTITGQCGLDWNGAKSTLELHVRASGVQSSHGEPFDGNIAVSVSAADRTIEGRAEILRIGPRHLLDLLDMQDPQHVDPAMNRIRTALHFGYPDSLRLVFDHGFASAHLQLGGLARLVSIGEIRGIPMGPIVDKMIASMLEEGEGKRTL